MSAAQDAETVVRPWDDPNDPEPEAFTEDGRWRAEFIDWAKRSGHRRWLYYFGPDGVLIDRDGRT